jgi:hypothetical protein
MNRSLWSQSFSEHYCPPFPCPTCGKGVFSLVPKSLVYKETQKSKHEHGIADNWCSYDTDFRFTAWLKCGHSSCREEAVVIGIGGVEDQMTQEGSEPTEFFLPRFCLPMPDLIAISQKCPAQIASELRASFALFWADRAAAANRIRGAVESILTHFKIPRRKRTANARFHRLTLDERLKLFTRVDSASADRLMAIKWFGNTGSHGHAISRDEVLDVLEILEDTLVELFERRKQRITALTRTVMKKHAPKRKTN